MNKYAIRSKKGGGPTTVKGNTPYDALCKFASKAYDSEWYVDNDLCVCNPVSGWNIQYSVELLC